jgi:hypothetical protein
LNEVFALGTVMMLLENTVWDAQSTPGQLAEDPCKLSLPRVQGPRSPSEVQRDLPPRSLPRLKFAVMFASTSCA